MSTGIGAWGAPGWPTGRLRRLAWWRRERVDGIDGDGDRYAVGGALRRQQGQCGAGARNGEGGERARDQLGPWATRLAWRTRRRIITVSVPYESGGGRAGAEIGTVLRWRPHRVRRATNIDDARELAVQDDRGARRQQAELIADRYLGGLASRPVAERLGLRSIGRHPAAGGRRRRHHAGTEGVAGAAVGHLVGHRDGTGDDDPIPGCPRRVSSTVTVSAGSRMLMVPFRARLHGLSAPGAMPALRV